MECGHTGPCEWIDRDLKMQQQRRGRGALSGGRIGGSAHPFHTSTQQDREQQDPYLLIGLNRQPVEVFYVKEADAETPPAVSLWSTALH